MNQQPLRPTARTEVYQPLCDQVDRSALATMSGPLSESEIESKVIEAIADQLGVARTDVTRASEFDKICDSLDKAELMMEFEDLFEISITDESASKLSTVSDAIDFIQRTLAGSR